LISQDDGTAIRFLLADGLGSTRVEMVGNVVETTTTYEPYGKLLAQTGSSGTVYGFTGEQHDALTGLTYLRARYYSPDLRIFFSRDPFPGKLDKPSSQNGYNYVSGNPVNFYDPTGQREWATPSSWGEKITGWIHMARNPAFIHLEFNRFLSPPGSTPFGWRSQRPDIIHSHTGDVFEVEPWYKGAVSIALGISEATLYRDMLTAWGGGGPTFFGGVAPGYNLLPGRGILPPEPNDWNIITWRLGRPSSFPPIIRSGPLTIRGTIQGRTAFIPGGFDFIAVSPVDGVVVWWLQPNKSITVAALAAAKLHSVYKEHIVEAGGRVPSVPGIPAPAPVPSAPSTSLSPWYYVGGAAGVTALLYGLEQACISFTNLFSSLPPGVSIQGALATGGIGSHNGDNIE
jgi:RHS repeat-associated protein